MHVRRDDRRVSLARDDLLEVWEVAAGSACRTLHHGRVGNRTDRPADWGPRGLDFSGSYAVVGLSRPRHDKTFGGLALDEELDRLPPRYGAFAGMTIFLLTALVATPLIAGTLGRLLQPVARRLLSLEGRLASDNLVSSPGRTGLVIAALAATGALIVMTAMGYFSTLAFSEMAARRWL